MFQIVNDLFQSDFKNFLAFKWWTLAYFLYQLPRFSTDLDFDLIQETPNLMENVAKILQKYGTIKDEKEKQFTYFFLLDYGSHEHNIKVEISKTKYQNTEYAPINFFGKSILAMSPSSMFAHKLVALSERMKNRDLFDVDFFFKQHFPLNQAIITERTQLSYPDFLAKLVELIPQYFKANTILAEIGDLINEKQKAFMKTQMVEEVLWFLRLELFKLQK